MVQVQVFEKPLDEKPLYKTKTNFVPRVGDVIRHELKRLQVEAVILDPKFRKADVYTHDLVEELLTKKKRK